MTEVEYNRLLDRVAGALDVDTRRAPSDEPEFRNEAPRAANDNTVAWPLLPFPQGWAGSC